MPRTTALLIAALASVAIGRRAVVGQPHAGPGAADDPTRDWPKPELRAGLSDAQITASIAAYAKQLHDAGHFSGVVLAARAGKVVVSGAYGLANLAANTPNTLDTRFNIGSLNKLFTKVAIAQLAEAGKLSLDDTLRTHLPQLPVAGADRISIRQLLEHRSGMGDIFGPRYDAAPPSRLRELDDFVPLFADQPLAFEPGSSERYSNAGYVTLGLIVERLTGEKYRDYVTRHIFAPAHMASTGLWALDERVPERATGYTRHGKDRELDELVPNTDRLPGRPSSAGGAFATAGDLLRFWDAVLAGKLLSARWTNWVVNGSFDDAGRTPALGLGGGAPGVNASIETNGAWIDIEVAGTAMKVDVDTGSPAVLSVPSSWTTALRFAGQPTIRKGRTTVNEFEIRTAELRGDIRVAGFTQASPRVDVVDLFPVANLGAQFLRQYTVTFDLANHRMALAR